MRCYDPLGPSLTTSVLLTGQNRYNPQVPQPTAPIIIPANIEEDKMPMRLSGTEKGSCICAWMRDMETYAKSDVVREGVLWPLLVSTSNIALSRKQGGKCGVILTLSAIQPL
jgi:hypothetical protein